MSAAIETFSPSKQVALSNDKGIEEVMDEKKKINSNGDEGAENDHDHVDDDDEEDRPKLKSQKDLDLGPQVSLKEQLEKDKDDESLRRWKEQLLGSVDMSVVGESKEADVNILSLSIMSDGRPEIVLPIPFSANNSKNTLFSLKERSNFRLKFTFTVSNNIVSGLNYTNTVWKTGLRVDKTEVMLGTFSPQQEPYTYALEEETTPSGIFARGSYFASAKIVDDDGKCYLDASYYFDIAKNWPSSS